MVGPSRPRSRRGFTLIEVLVASAVGIVILTAVLGYLLHRSKRDHQEAQLARLKQEASLLMRQLQRELRQAGLGRPSRARREGRGEIFPGPLLFADASSLAFVADLSRPDASFPSLSSFAANQDLPPLPERGVALLNELNGGCDVDDSSPSPCRTDEASLLLAPSGQDCLTSPDSAPSCPWGLLKFRPGEWLVLVDGVGRWVERRVAPQLFGNASGRLALILDQPLPSDFFRVPNRGWVASLDRVFFRLEERTVSRMQCWGQVGLLAALDELASPCSSGGEGTGWEPLLRSASPQGLVFRYLDAQGAELRPLPLAPTELRRVRRVEISLHLEASSALGPVAYDTFSSVSLRH